MQEEIKTYSNNKERRKTKTEEFLKVLDAHQNEKLLIIIKGFPDPDSIGAALAHRFIANRYNIDSTVLYFQDISHQSNKALVKKLELEIVKYSEDFDLTGYNAYSLLDSQSVDIPILDKLSNCAFLSFVDHHKRIANPKAEFVDIRENAGSTCSIYTEYLKEGGFTLLSGNYEHIRLATAMLYGIMSDTDNYYFGKPIDFEAAAFLSSVADKDLLKAISTQSISAKAMDILQNALEMKQIRGNYLISGVGFVREEDRDGIAQAADYLMNREGIDTVIVYGIVDGKTIDGSLRTISDTVDPDKFIKDLFGVDKNGKPYGGGRVDKGGFQIPIGIFAKCDNKDLIWKVVKETIEDMFYKKIGLEENNKD